MASLLATLIAATPAAAHAGSRPASPVAADHLARVLAKQAAGARASSAAPRLPLPAPLARPAATRDGLERLAGTVRPRRLLVGLRSHQALPSLLAELRSLGTRVRAIEELGVIGVTAPVPALVVARLRDDPRVAYVEANATRRLAGDGEAIDPETGLRFTWAYDAVEAGAALAQVPGSSFPVAVIDSGLDVRHPDLAGRIGPVVDVQTNGTDVQDTVGHGTFVAGLVSAVDGNGIGGKGVAGSTTVLAAQVSATGDRISSEVVSAAIVWAIRAHARIVNLSLGSALMTESDARALDLAFFQDVTPIASAGNEALDGNPVVFPAALIGGRRGGRGTGLSVGATKPDGQPAVFSSFNDFVTVAAPGAGQGGCDHGVFSTLPTDSATTLWDQGGPCAGRTFGKANDPAGRWAYGEGTSFAAPIAAGVAALAWQANRELASEQVADVIRRSARQTFGPPGWNRHTGAGVVNAPAALALARRYDTTDPTVSMRVARRGRSRLAVRVRATDRTGPGEELAGRPIFALQSSPDGRNYSFMVQPRRAPITRSVRLLDGQPRWLRALVCDANFNCVARTRGPFLPRR